jgi:hypothetical protein
VKLITSDELTCLGELRMITGRFRRVVDALGAWALLVAGLGAIGCEDDSETSRPAVPVSRAGSGGAAGSTVVAGRGAGGAAGTAGGGGLSGGAGGASSAGAGGIGGQPDDSDAGLVEDDGADAGVASETDAGSEGEDGGVEEIPEARLGHWTGMTSQREPIEFELTSAGLSELTVSVSFAGCDAESATEFSPAEAIGISPGFSLSLELEELGSAMFSGVFPGPNPARGVLLMTNGAPEAGEVACTGRVTWTASRDE